MSNAAQRKFGGYSKGMKRKLTIAAGVIHHPKILFLDEPTTGIDVASARQLRNLITRLNKSGTTIFLTTHYIEEAERLCDRIAFIVSGRIIMIDKTENLLQPVMDKHIVEISFKNSSESLLSELTALFPGLTFSSSAGDSIRIESVEPVHVGILVRFMEERSVEVLEAKKIKPSLEDVFVKVTGIEADLMRIEKGTTRGTI